MNPPAKPRSLPAPKPKRLRTKRQRDAAKFGPKTPQLFGDPRRGFAARPAWFRPRRWKNSALGSPPKPVLITQNRLSHRGIFNHQVKSLDVRRLLTPGPGGDGPGAARKQQNKDEDEDEEEEEVGGAPGEALKELAATLASLLGTLGAFSGRDLANERRRSLVAALRKHRRGPPDFGVFLSRKTPAQPPGIFPKGKKGGGSGDFSPFPTPKSEGVLVFFWVFFPHPEPPREEARAGPSQTKSRGWELRTPSPLRAVNTVSTPPKNKKIIPQNTPKFPLNFFPPFSPQPLPPPRPPSPVFGAQGEVSLEIFFGGGGGNFGIFIDFFLPAFPPAESFLLELG